MPRTTRTTTYTIASARHAHDGRAGKTGAGQAGRQKGSRVCRIRRRHTCDEFGDQPLAEIAAVRVAGLPPERDLYFEPRRLSEIEAHLARHGSGP